MTAGNQPFTIPARFNGPPTSGNGGYVCGRLAGVLTGAPTGAWPEVTLRSPPPLDTVLEVRPTADGMALYDGETVLANARWAVQTMDVPPAPDLAAARNAMTRYACLIEHPLPTCFVCGTARDEGDGLRLFTGPVNGAPRGLVAAPWTPHPAHGDSNGQVPDEIVWAALDCPGAFGVEAALPETGLKLLGRLSAVVHESPHVGTDYIVGGWSLGSEGRKHGAGTAVWDLDGRVLARAKATWIELKS